MSEQTYDLVEPLEANIFRTEFLDDPRPVYHAMRERSPVLWSSLIPPGQWIVTRHSDAMAVLRDGRLGKQDYWDQMASDRGGLDSDVIRVLRTWMSQIDPPDHGRIRSLFTRTFVPSSIERLKPRIEAIVDGLLDDMERAWPADFMTAVAFPLPAIVICEMLGVPPEDRDQFKRWSLDLTHVFDPFVGEETLQRSYEAIVAFRTYLGKLIAQRLVAPQADLLSELVQAHHAEGKLSDEELMANTIFMVWAGHETTMSLLGNGLLTLLRHPDVYASLRDDSDASEAIVEECLRHEGPIRITSRIALEDLEVGGKAITAGQMVVVMGAAANCDPQIFDDPDRFVVSRRPNRHLGFGGGIHFCLGAPLARAEVQIAFRRIAERFPTLQLVPESATWATSLFLRRLERLEVTC